MDLKQDIQTEINIVNHLSEGTIQYMSNAAMDYYFAISDPKLPHTERLELTSKQSIINLNYKIDDYEIKYKKGYNSPLFMFNLTLTPVDEISRINVKKGLSADKMINYKIKDIFKNYAISIKVEHYHFILD
jgi:hypothetical protein